jgi:hypothetical protein
MQCRNNPTNMVGLPFRNFTKYGYNNRESLSSLLKGGIIMDSYFLLGTVLKKYEEDGTTLYDIILYDGTKLNKVDLDISFQTVPSPELEPVAIF